jgi:hypothetical protein
MLHALSALAAAGPESKEQARVLADQAANAFAEGDYTRADQLLRAAYVHFEAPTIALLHARTLLRLQRLLAAQKAYERASEAPLTSDAPKAFQRAVVDARAEASALAQRIPRIRLELGQGLARASVRRLELDGRRLAEAEFGRFVPVDPGRHHVRVESVDGTSASKAIDVGERQAATVVVELPTRRNASDFAWAWGSLSLGGVGVATGIATGIVALRAHSDAREACGAAPCLEAGDGARDVERFRRYRTISTVGYAVGAIGLGLGAYLLIRLPRESPVVQLSVASRSGALELGGAF